LTKYRDDVCKIGKCVNVGVCLGLCPLVQDVDGTGKSKEPLLNDIVKNTDISADRDYNAELSGLASDRENRMESDFDRMCELVAESQKLPFYHKRKIAITILLTLGFLKIDIEGFFKLSHVQLWRIRK